MTNNHMFKIYKTKYSHKKIKSTRQQNILISKLIKNYKQLQLGKTRNYENTTFLFYQTKTYKLFKALHTNQHSDHEVLFYITQSKKKRIQYLIRLNILGTLKSQKTA